MLLVSKLLYLDSYIWQCMQVSLDNHLLNHVISMSLSLLYLIILVPAGWQYTNFEFGISYQGSSQLDGLALSTNTVYAQQNGTSNKIKKVDAQSQIDLTLFKGLTNMSTQSFYLALNIHTFYCDLYTSLIKIAHQVLQYRFSAIYTQRI